MKILLVSERSELKSFIRRNFMPRGAEIVQYYDPIKAMDNLDEVDPDVVLFSAQDFPRHWKPFLVFLRDSRTRDECVFVVLTGDEFDLDEADKAQTLQVNGIVHEQLTDRRELTRLKELVNRYRDIGDMRSEKRLVPTPADRVAFAFAHPETLQLVSGAVEDLSATGVSIVPSDRGLTEELAVSTVIPACSLRVGDTILPCSARVTRNERAVSFVFTGLPDSHRGLVRKYIGGHPQRQLDLAAAEAPTEVEPV